MDPFRVIITIHNLNQYKFIIHSFRQMKVLLRIILIFSIVCPSNIVLGQNLYFGIKVGINYTNQISMYKNVVKSEKFDMETSKIGAKAGVFMDININKRFSFVPG